MTKVEVPKQVKIVCDFCGKTLDPQDRRREAKLTLGRSALDYQDNPVADATVSFDMCDRCERNVSESINSMLDEAYGGSKA